MCALLRLYSGSLQIWVSAHPPHTQKRDCSAVFVLFTWLIKLRVKNPLISHIKDVRIAFSQLGYLQSLGFKKKKSLGLIKYIFRSASCLSFQINIRVRKSVERTNIHIQIWPRIMFQSLHEIYNPHSGACRDQGCKPNTLLLIRHFSLILGHCANIIGGHMLAVRRCDHVLFGCHPEVHFVFLKPFIPL